MKKSLLPYEETSMTTEHSTDIDLWGNKLHLSLAGKRILIFKTICLFGCAGS